MAKARKTSKPAPKKAAAKKPAVKASAKSKSAVKPKSTVKSKTKPSSKGTSKVAAKTATKKSVSYAKSDLDVFRLNIERQIADSREELGNVTEHLMDSVSGEYEEENSVYSLHMADQGTDAMEREKDFLQAQRLNDYIKKLDESMKRIEDGSYGVCVVCGRLIEKQRLLAVPVTQKHVDCKNKEAATTRQAPREETPLHHFPEMN